MKVTKFNIGEVSVFLQKMPCDLFKNKQNTKLTAYRKIKIKC